MHLSLMEYSDVQEPKYFCCTLLVTGTKYKKQETEKLLAPKKA